MLLERMYPSSPILLSLLLLFLASSPTLHALGDSVASAASSSSSSSSSSATTTTSSGASHDSTLFLGRVSQFEKQLTVQLKQGNSTVQIKPPPSKSTVPGSSKARRTTPPILMSRTGVELNNPRLPIPTTPVGSPLLPSFPDAILDTTPLNTTISRSQLASAFLEYFKTYVPVKEVQLQCAGSSCPDLAPCGPAFPNLRACHRTDLVAPIHIDPGPPENCPKLEQREEPGGIGADLNCSHAGDYVRHDRTLFQYFEMRDVMMDWNGVVFNRSMHFFRHGCFSDANFSYPSTNTSVLHVGRMVSMVYTPATSFYHSIIEWVPQWLLLKELLQEHPTMLIAMRAAQLQLYNNTLKHIIGVEPAHLNLFVLDWQHRNTLIHAEALYQPVYRCCGRATPSIWRFLRRNFLLPPDGLPVFQPETFRLRRTSPLDYQDITDILSQRDEQQSGATRRLDVILPAPVPSLADTFGMTTGLNWVTILVRRPGNLSRNLEEGVYERVRERMWREFGERRVVVFDGSLPLMEARALFRRAVLLVGTHGAALTNLLFMPRGAFLLEIRPRGYPNACYHHLASAAQLHYWLLLGNGTKDSALQVDPGEVLSAVREVARKVFAAMRGESKEVQGRGAATTATTATTATAAVTGATAAISGAAAMSATAVPTKPTTPPSTSSLSSSASTPPISSLPSPLTSSSPASTTTAAFSSSSSPPPPSIPPLAAPSFPLPLFPTFPSGCSCYRLRNAFCCGQAVCVCHNVCYNGSALLGRFGPEDAGGDGAAAAADVSSHRRLSEELTTSPSSTAASSSSVPLLFPPRSPHPCLPPIHAPPTTNKSALLIPTPCNNLPQFGRMLRSALSEAPVPGGLQSAGDRRWRRWVKGEAEWRMGGTLLVPLTHQTTNVAHFLGKAAHILLVNNASTTTGLPRVARFLLPRADWTVHRMKEHGPHGWLPSMLHLLLRMALEPLFPSSLLPALLASISPSALLTPGPLAGGRVEFEAQWNAASDDKPMCFDTLVVPGLLKAITFNGMAEEAERVRQRLREVFLTADGQPIPDIMAPGTSSGSAAAGSSGTTTSNSSSGSGSGSGSGTSSGSDRHYTDDGSPVRLLYVTRNDTMTTGRRVMHVDSHRALKDLFQMLKFQVTTTEYAVLPFAQQLALTDSAEIIVALHGAGLTNPTCFARADAIVLEISPYGVFYDLYYYTAINAGINYMMYQCTAGPPPAPANDSLYAGMSPPECDRDAACKKYRTHTRRVHLAEADVAEIGKLLEFAREIVMDVRRFGRDGAGKRLRESYGERCVEKKLRKECRMSFLRSPIADPDYECILSLDCPYIQPV